MNDDANRLTEPHNTLLDFLDRQGYAVLDGFLPDCHIRALRDRAHQLQQDGVLHRAGVGKGNERRHIDKVRGDAIHWLEADSQDDSESRYLGVMEQLRISLNRHYYMGLFEFETHYAIYPPGAGYQKHLDQFKSESSRQVSAILYLNQDWGEDDGGALRLYLNGTADDTHIDIMPVGGRLILFLSARFPHEVLPARRERISLTGWFRRRRQD